MNTEKRIPPDNRFQVGGGVGRGRFYVERDVDERVFLSLSKGEHCYLFAPKQSGKSSLTFKLQQRLEEKNLRSVYLDMSVLFSSDSESSADSKPDDNSLCKQFTEGLGAELGIKPKDSTGAHWPGLAADSAMRLVRSVTERLIPKGEERLIIFLDESDTIGAFFPESRELASGLAELMETPGTESPPVTFCLLGSLPSESLGEWDKRLPSLLHPARIDDFTKDGLKVFQQAIEPIFSKCEPEDVLNECFRRTKGHPYLTQLLLHQAVVIGDKSQERLSEALDDFTREELPAKFRDTWKDAEERILSPELSTVSFKAWLDLYRILLEDDIPADTDDPRQISLYLSGLAAFRDSRQGLQLCPRNRIFSSYFNQKWLEKAFQRAVSLEALPQSPDPEREIVELVDQTLCQPQEGEPAPYKMKGKGRILLENQIYEFRLANREGRPRTLQLFKGIGGIGGELWHRVARTLTRISAHRHIALPKIETGAYKEQKDFAYIITQAGHVTLGESPDTLEALRKDPRKALVHFARLAEGLARLHQNRLTHRNLHPGTIDVVEQFGKEPWHLRLSRFEMSDLVGSLIRSLDPRRKDPASTLRTATEKGASDQLLSVRQIQQLYAARGMDDLICLAPERLAWLFQSSGRNMLDGFHSDIFSLGMVVYPWFVDELPPERVREVFADDGYDPEAHDALLRERAGAIGRSSLPKRFKELLDRMLSPSRRTRPTASQVVNEIAGSFDGFDELERKRSGRTEADRFIVAYLPKEIVEYFRHRTWIKSGPETPAGGEELLGLLNEDLRHAKLTYSSQGAAPFEQVPNEQHKRAKFALMGNRFTHFCDIYRKGGLSGKLEPRVLLIRYSHPVDKTTRWGENRIGRRAPGIEIFPIDADEIQSPEEIGKFSEWTEILDSLEQMDNQGRSRPGAPSDDWREKVFDALEWLLTLNRCRIETRIYPVTAKRITGIRYELIHDENRQIDYLRKDDLRDQLAKHRRPLMGEFCSDVADQQNGHLMLLPDNHGQPDWGKHGVEVRFAEKSAGDRVTVELTKPNDIPPKFVWLQSPEDTGAIWQLMRQRKAYDELMEIPALVDQLGNPVSVVRLRNQWRDIDKNLKGDAPDVIRQMLDSWPFFALHGPPGTGKTTVAAEAIRLALEADRHQRILISAQSHDALDNLADRIIKGIGNRGRGNAEILRIASRRTVDKVRPEMRGYVIDERTQRRIGKIQSHCKGWLENDSRDDVSREKLRPVVERWRDTVDSCEMELRDRLRRGSNLIFCTTGAANENYLGRVTSGSFDWVIIEEAAKAWPTELAMALTWGNRWTLIGDHKQLPAFGKEEVATVLADLAELRDKPELRLHGRRRDAYLEVFDLFPRLFETDRKEKTESTKLPPAPGWSGYAAKPVARLTRQFRMRSDIANLVSEVFYTEKKTGEKQDGKHMESGLKTDPSADARKSPIVLPPWLREGALHWIDTGLPNRGLAPEKPYWWNPGEITVVKGLLSRLEKENSKQQDLASHFSILSPYLRQVEELRHDMGQFIRCVDTVDAFQGRESNIVIVSMVRCNEHKTQRQQLGFLARPERINVLFSRARDLLIIVGSFDHFDRSVPFEDQESRLWVDLCRGIRQHGKRHDAKALGLIDGSNPGGAKP